MRILLLLATTAFLAISLPLDAQPAAHPEDAVVFIEVSLQTTDPATGQQRLTKVGEGSGFLINSKGWVITAAHVTKVEVPQNAKLVIKGSRRSREAEKITMEQPPLPVVNSDVVLLRFPPGLGIAFPYLCVVRQPDIATGQKVVGIGFPLGQDFSIRPGQVTSLSGPNGWIQTNLGLARGMSGGPVLNEQQAVIGVVNSGIEGESSFDYFLPINLALPLFDVPPASYVGTSCNAGKTDFLGPGVPTHLVVQPFSDNLPADEGKQIARSFERDILELASKHYPMSGDWSLTQQQSIDKFVLAWLQSKTGLVQLKLLQIPKGAARLSTNSHKVIDAPHEFEPLEWALIERENKWEMLQASLNNDYWIIPDDMEQKSLAVLSFFKGDHIILAGNRGYAGSRQQDVAGEVQSAQFVIGGRIDNLRISGIYEIAPNETEKLFPVPDNRIKIMVMNPADKIQWYFEGPVNALSAAAPKDSDVKAFLQAFDDINKSGRKWIGVQVSPARGNILLTISGKKVDR